MSGELKRFYPWWDEDEGLQMIESETIGEYCLCADVAPIIKELTEARQQLELVSLALSNCQIALIKSEESATQKLAALEADHGWQKQL